MHRCTLVPAFLLLLSCTTSDSAKAKEVLQEKISGKPAVLNFWASWCSFCKEELPLFQALHEENLKIAMVGINLQEEKDTADTYWSNGGYTFPTIQDPESELKAQYQVFTQPTTIFVNESGRIIERKDGPLSESELEEMIQKLRKHSVQQEISPEVSDTPLQKTSKEETIETEEPVTAKSKALKIHTSPLPSPQDYSKPWAMRLLGRWFGENVQHSMPLEIIMSGGPDKDGIPSIDEPKFVTSEQARFLNDDDVGTLYSYRGDTRFYPFRILNWHEIVNDRVGGRPIMVTYCPLCASAVVYDRRISEGTAEFGVSGFLANSNLLMYDRLTESLWNQITGEAVVGQLTGEELTLLPSDIVVFATVKNSYPDATILSTETGHKRAYSTSPYRDYEKEQEVMFPVHTIDDRLQPKELVYGVTIGDQAKAYTLRDIKSANRIEDTLNGTPIRIEWDSDRESVRFTNSTTNSPVDAIYGFWFSWVAQYPETELFTLLQEPPPPAQ